MDYNDELKNCNKKNCEKCGGAYATGKFYGDWWRETPEDKKPNGLCEFCNPNSKWYIGNN